MISYSRVVCGLALFVAITLIGDNSTEAGMVQSIPIGVYCVGSEYKHLDDLRDALSRLNLLLPSLTSKEGNLLSDENASIHRDEQSLSHSFDYKPRTDESMREYRQRAKEIAARKYRNVARRYYSLWYARYVFSEAMQSVNAITDKSSFEPFHSSDSNELLKATWTINSLTYFAISVRTFVDNERGRPSERLIDENRAGELEAQSDDLMRDIVEFMQCKIARISPESTDGEFFERLKQRLKQSGEN